jgi:hypothetical protein
MKTRNYGLYAVALAIVVVGAIWAGVPVQSLAVLGLVLVCPLMMFFMMRGMHGASPEESRREEDQSDRPHEPSAR